MRHCHGPQPEADAVPDESEVVDGAVGGSEEEEELIPEMDEDELSRLMEEHDNDAAGLDIEDLLEEVNEVDQTILGERRRTGIFSRGDEVEEDAALNLVRNLNQRKRRIVSSSSSSSSSPSVRPTRQRARHEEEEEV